MMLKRLKNKQRCEPLGAKKVSVFHMPFSTTSNSFIYIIHEQVANVDES